jgi:hypothetical protein
MGRAVAATSSLKKVPGPRLRVPLPRQPPVLQGPVCVGVTVEIVSEVSVVVVMAVDEVLVTRVPSLHSVTAGLR